MGGTGKSVQKCYENAGIRGSFLPHIYHQLNPAFMKNTILSAFFIFLTTLLTGQSVTIDSTFGVNGVATTNIQYVSTSFILGDNLCVLPTGAIITAAAIGDTFALHKMEANGVSSTDFTSPRPNFYPHSAGAALLADGRIVACGYSRDTPVGPAIICLDQTGKVDSTFGIDGIASIYSYHDLFSNLLPQADGKILIYGSKASADGIQNSHVLIHRFNSDGTLDSSFAQAGVFMQHVSILSSEFINTAVEQPDGKLLFAGAGQYRFLFLRLNPDGTVDSTFSGDGKLLQTGFNGWVDQVVLQPDGKIVVIGDDGMQGMFARYKPNGTRDSSFATNGLRYIPETYEGVVLAILPNGKILGGLKAEVGPNIELVLAQLLPDGQLDPSFGDNGLYFSHILMRCRTMDLLDGNKVLISGQAPNYDIIATRFLLDLSVGTINPTAPADPTLWVYPNPVADQFSLDFGLSQRADVRIQLYDTQGKLVQTLLQEQTFEAGDHQANLQLETPIPAGVYVLCLEIAGSPRSSIQIVKR